MTTDTHSPKCPGPQAHVTIKGHPSCTAHVRTGGPCPNPPNHGERVCRMHGSNGRSKAKAARATVQAEALAAVVLFAARRDVEPGQALLELVQWTAGEVDYWRQEVRLIERDALTWGMTRQKASKSPDSPVISSEVTREAKPNIAYVMLTDSSNRLAVYAVAALKAGVQERAIQLSEQQGVATVGVLRIVLVAMFDVVLKVLRERGVSDAAIIDALHQAWTDAMGVIVPREFRRLTDGGL